MAPSALPMARASPDAMVLSGSLVYARCSPTAMAFAPDYAPEEISEIADRLKQAAGIS